jgi:hypothetical protein
VEYQPEIGTHADQRERALENQGEPGSDSPDRPDQRPEGAVQKVVRSSRPRHGGGQLRLAEHRRHDQHAGECIGQHHAGPRVRRRDAREQEETRADHRTGGDDVDVEERELLLQAREVQQAHGSASSSVRPTGRPRPSRPARRRR